MLLLALLNQVRDQVDPLFVFYTMGAAEDLIGFMLRELGVAPSGNDIAGRRDALHRVLLERRGTSKPILAVIDEAHNLHADSFKEIDSLLNQTPQTFQMILAGQPQLRDDLNAIAPPGLRQRVAAAHGLLPLSGDQTCEYVRHRLSVAGYAGRELFTPSALEFISVESSGIPRRINLLCSHALDHGSTLKKRPIDEQIITEVVSRLGFFNLEPARASTYWRISDQKVPTAPEAPSVSLQSRSSDHEHAFCLARLIRSWLLAHSGIWSGTAGALYGELLLYNSSDLAAISIFSPSDLAQSLDRDAPTMFHYGIDAKMRASHPKWINLRATRKG
jgi:type II secretory pathway predicted ATPase ExeA